jgi:hypothetical protein
MKVLLDTSVLIDVLRYRNQRHEWLAELVRGGHVVSTTTLNIAEIYAGMRPGRGREDGSAVGGPRSARTQCIGRKNCRQAEEQLGTEGPDFSTGRRDHCGDRDHARVRAGYRQREGFPHGGSAVVSDAMSWSVAEGKDPDVQPMSGGAPHPGRLIPGNLDNFETVVFAHMCWQESRNGAIHSGQFPLLVNSKPE